METKLPDEKSYYVIRKEKSVTLSPNTCPHRGFPLLMAGEKKRLPISCALHLTRALPVPVVAREKGGMILLKEGASTTEYWLGKIVDEMGDEFHREERWVTARPEVWLWGTMDPNHLKTVHPDGFSNSFASLPPVTEQVELEPKGSSYALKLSTEVVDQYRKLLKTDAVDPYFRHYVLYPNLSVSSFLGVFLTFETAQLSNARTQVLTRLFTAKRFTVPKKLIESAIEGTKTILDEDAASCGRWALGNPFSPPSHWLQGEERAKAYWDYLAARQFG